MNFFFYLNYFINSYIYFFTACFFLSSLLFFLSYFLVNQRRDAEKQTAYECGFQPFKDTFVTFEVKYYVLAVLFLVFDVELLFFYPYVFCIKELGFFGFYLFIFISILFVFAYVIEIYFGVLKWD